MLFFVDFAWQNAKTLQTSSAALNFMKTVSFMQSNFGDKPVRTNETGRVTFDKTRLPGANDRHGAIDFGNVVVGVATARVLRKARGAGGAAPRVTDLYGPSVPIRPSHHITKSSLHKHDATPTWEQKRAILRAGFANDVKAYNVPSAYLLC